uniref:Uncharacterized protein n=1 Tax=Pseudomonas zanjanensis TaxID=2745496 RepID=A0A923JJ02_9PSED
MSVQKKVERNLLGEAGDLLTPTWPSQWTRRADGDDGGADLVYVTSPDIERRYVYLYGAVEASIEFDLPVDLNLTAEAGYQVRFLYQPTQRSSENPKVRAYFNARAHYWEYELHTSNVREGVEQPRDWLTCDETIALIDENTQPKAVLAFQSGLFDPSSPDVDITSGPENDQPIAQEPGWPGGRGELHFSGKAQGSDVAPEVAFGVSLFLHLKPLQLATDQPMPELDGVVARYWVEKGGHTYMPICRGGGSHHLDLPVTEACGWAGGGIYKGTSAYASFTNQDEAGQARLQVTPTEPDADDEAQHIAKVWDIRNDADASDDSVDGKTATLRFESVYHAPNHETLACIVGPYKLDITRHILPEFWPSVEEGETIDLHVKVRYTVSDKIEPGIDVQWRHDGDLLTTIPTRDDGWSAYRYTPTGDTQLVATIDSPYKAESDTHAQAFDIKTIPTGKWTQFELSVDAEDISPGDPWRILPGQSYEVTLKPRSGSVMIGEDLTLTVDEPRLQVEPTEARTLVEGGLTWTVTTSSVDIGDFTLSLGCIRFKQSPTWTGTTNRLPALTIAEADGNQLDPLAAVATLTAVVPQYDDMRGTDKISVTWTGETGSPQEGSHSTTPVEVGAVGAKSIELPVGLIAYALGKPVTVTYTVTRGSTSLPAPDTLTLNVIPLPESALEPSRPYFRYVAQEDGVELDVGNLPDNIMMQVDIWPHIAVGQHLWMRLKGHKADGTEHNNNIWTPPGPSVSGIWLTQGYYRLGTAISNYLRELGDGSVLTVEFKVAFGQSTDEAHATLFPLRTYTIRAAFDAGAPSVEQATDTAPNQRLEPLDAQDSLTVVIPDYGTQSGDQVSVTWTGTAGGGIVTVGPQPLPTTRKIEVPVSVIAYNLGQTVTVTYTVTRDTGVKPPSAPLTLVVGSLAESALAPSRPYIRHVAQEDGAELDVGNLPDSVSIQIDIWPHIAVGQHLWMRLKGHKADGTEHNNNIWTPPGPSVSGIWLTQGYYRLGTAISNYLRELGDGSVLTVEFKVAFGQSTDEAHATLFPLRTYTIRAAFDAGAPSVEQATDTAPNQRLEPLDAQDSLTVVIPDYGTQSGDQVSVTWTGTAGGGIVTVGPQPLPTTRKIEVPVSVIAYNLGQTVTVTYTVTRDTGVKPPSAPLTLVVGSLAESALAPSRPYIRHVAQEDGAELDVGNLPDSVSIQIDIWPHIAVGQHLWMRLKGYKADGTEHNQNIWTPPGPKVSEIWLTQGYYRLSTAISNYLRELGDGSTLTLEFKVAFGQSIEETQSIAFPLRTYTIRAAFNASAPSVKQARGNVPTQQLNPMEAKDNLTVVIPDYGIQPGDQVSVTWTGAAGTAEGGSHTTDVQALPSNREIEMPVSVIAFNLGTSVTVSYTVTRNSGTKPPSAALALAVDVLSQSDLEPGRPRILQAADSGSGDELDMDSVSGDITVRTGIWPHIAVGQYLWLRLKGSKADGAEHNLDIWAAPSAKVNERWLEDEFYNKLVSDSYDYLQELGGGSTLTLEFKVAFGQSTQESQATVFPSRTYTVKRMTPRLDNVKDMYGQEIPNGGATRYGAMTLSGQASKGCLVELYDSGKTPPVFQGVARADPITGVWSRPTVIRDEGFCRFYAASLYHSSGPVNSNERTLTFRR